MDRKKINILIAEDDPDLLRITQKLISSKYDSVYTATTGATCLEIALQIKPDLLLLDVILPDINGIEICRIIKNNPDTAHTYVLLLSSVKTSPDSISEGLEEGADGYFARPVTYRELVDRVD